MQYSGNAVQPRYGLLGLASPLASRVQVTNLFKLIETSHIASASPTSQFLYLRKFCAQLHCVAGGRHSGLRYTIDTR